MREWAGLHKEDLEADWELARREEPLASIDPTAMSPPYKIRSVEHLGDFRLRLAFADGRMTEIDLADKLSCTVGPVFEALRDPALFAQVAVDPELGTIMWPNGADLAPDALQARVVGVA